MKSLEIVNEKIDYIEISKGNIKEAHPYYYEQVLLKQLNELQQIKQDLEVLEIIMEKRIDILALKCRINTFKDDNEGTLHSYNAMRYSKKIYKLTMEELLKLKQWLEENENE